jgi:ribosomal protein S18 acetylase RimI-like enzyme
MAAALIRPLGPADAGAYRALRVRALTEHPEAFGRAPEEVPAVGALAEQFRADASSDTDFLLGAFDGTALVGTVGCRRERGVKQRHIAYIWGVYVASEHRRAGLGRELTLAAIARARTGPGLEALWLDVTTTNRGARALYAACGFASAGVKPRSLKVGERYYDEELMVLDLTAR